MLIPKVAPVALRGLVTELVQGTVKVVIPELVPVALRVPVAEVVRRTVKVLVRVVVLVPVTVPILEPVLDWTSAGGAALVPFVFFFPDDMVKQQSVSEKRKKTLNYSTCRG